MSNLREGVNQVRPLHRSYGSKETVTIRPIAERELRFDSARFADKLEQLASYFKRESLRVQVPI